VKIFNLPAVQIRQIHLFSGSRIRWDKKELDELQIYARKFLKSRKTPNRAVCRQFIDMSKKAGGQLHRRTADKIVKKISAMNVKARKSD
jgi:hypothetical protein